MSLSEISAVIIVRNAEGTLGETLASLRDFAEVVVYDNGSTDKTIEIARSFDNVELYVGEFLGFGKTKAHAVGLARNDWVFSLDADEAVSSGLRDSIDAVDLTDPATAYLVHRHNFLMGKRVRFSGWGNDWLVRLFHRGRHGFNDAAVHEKVLVGSDGRTARLKGALNHSAITELGQFPIKAARYSELRRQSGTKPLPQAVIVLKTLYSFLRCYVLKLGVLDGWRGLAIAMSLAENVFYKYMKPLADKKVAAEKAKDES